VWEGGRAARGVRGWMVGWGGVKWGVGVKGGNYLKIILIETQRPGAGRGCRWYLNVRHDNSYRMGGVARKKN
jgi:hypothetical protein